MPLLWPSPSMERISLQPYRPTAVLKHERTILAIDPGTRYMGVAVLEGHRLIYHGVKTMLNRTSPEQILREGKKAVDRLIRDFTPDLFAIERTFFAKNRRAALLNIFAD